MRKLLIALIKLYQWGLSPFLGVNCRFTPSCSRYTIEALQRYGCIRGTFLGIKRVARCHPWCAGGHDPVP